MPRDPAAANIPCSEGGGESGWRLGAPMSHAWQARSGR